MGFIFSYSFLYFFYIVKIIDYIDYIVLVLIGGIGWLVSVKLCKVNEKIVMVDVISVELENLLVVRVVEK